MYTLGRTFNHSDYQRWVEYRKHHISEDITITNMIREYRPNDIISAANFTSHPKYDAPEYEVDTDRPLKFYLQRFHPELDSDDTYTLWAYRTLVWDFIRISSIT